MCSWTHSKKQLLDKQSRLSWSCCSRGKECKPFLLFLSDWSQSSNLPRDSERRMLIGLNCPGTQSSENESEDSLRHRRIEYGSGPTGIDQDWSASSTCLSCSWCWCLCCSTAPWAQVVKAAVLTCLTVPVSVSVWLSVRFNVLINSIIQRLKCHIFKSKVKDKNMVSDFTDGPVMSDWFYRFKLFNLSVHLKCCSASCKNWIQTWF